MFIFRRVFLNISKYEIKSLLYVDCSTETPRIQRSLCKNCVVEYYSRVWTGFFFLLLYYLAGHKILWIIQLPN